MFYPFKQNNSGGYFNEPAICVIIEADSADEANMKAEEEGIYFDGCYDRIDCPCCGDRWYKQRHDDNGFEEPGQYSSGDIIEGRFAGSLYDGIPSYLIVYKNDDRKVIS